LKSKGSLANASLQRALKKIKNIGKESTKSRSRHFLLFTRSFLQHLYSVIARFARLGALKPLKTREKTDLRRIKGFWIER
ncbi:hypothetical protein, partial [Atopococcus tabaci]|uniref:hypothetical protein n=1 Tax=Atopococcus tabaci TaxID=269774 RepID=UPI00054E71BA